MLEVALDDAAALGLLRVELRVHASNENAVAFYRGTGFKVEGLQKLARHIDGHFEDVVLMAKLDPSIARQVHQS